MLLDYVYSSLPPGTTCTESLDMYTLSVLPMLLQEFEMAWLIARVACSQALCCRYEGRLSPQCRCPAHSLRSTVVRGLERLMYGATTLVLGYARLFTPTKFKKSHHQQTKQGIQ